ncbi:MAG: phosphoglycerate kinase [Thermoplasmata archaeon]|nr:phosphoglycerate kinase [Thermoplasmata archaeon]
MHKKTIRDVDVKGKRVLVRVDFNVPLDKTTFAVKDDTRIKEALPTIKYLMEHGAKTILVSHLGRPKGKDQNLKMDNVAKKLEELLGKPVMKLDDTVGDAVKGAVAKMKEGDVCLLENVRFYPEEEKNDPEFSKKLAELADLYVNDAFGTAHRAHSSTAGVAQFLPAVAGFLIEKEVTVMGKALSNPEKPFIAVLGGAKVSDKIGVIENLLPKVNAILIGGAMAFTFLKAKGYTVGKSLVEDDKLGVATEIMKKAEEKGVKLHLPVDVVVADKPDDTATVVKTVKVGEIPADLVGVDIGPETAKIFSGVIVNAKTVIWNGPMGVFEAKKFREGTRAIAEALSKVKGTTIVGGGDSASAIQKLGFGDKVSHISTGGGASLEFLEGRELPGIAVLQNK